MSNSNIQLVWFQTTKGHFGKKDLYLKTLNNLKKHTYNLNYFDNKFLSLKVFNDDNYDDIVKNFDGFKHFLWHKHDNRINEESPYKDYSYYLLTNYLGDIARCYQEIKRLGTYSKYTYLVEDDSPVILTKPLAVILNSSIEKLEKEPDLFSVHLKRIGVFKEDANYLSGEIPIMFSLDHLFSSPHDYNFQNQVFRTDDMIKVSEKILENYDYLMQLHTERAVRTAIYDVFPKAYFVSWNATVGHSIHIGTSDADKWIENYELN